MANAQVSKGDHYLDASTAATEASCSQHATQESCSAVPNTGCHWDAGTRACAQTKSMYVGTESQCQAYLQKFSSLLSTPKPQMVCSAVKPLQNDCACRRRACRRGGLRVDRRAVRAGRHGGRGGHGCLHVVSWRCWRMISCATSRSGRRRPRPHVAPPGSRRRRPTARARARRVARQQPQRVHEQVAWTAVPPVGVVRLHLRCFASSPAAHPRGATLAHPVLPQLKYGAGEERHSARLWSGEDVSDNREEEKVRHRPSIEIRHAKTGGQRVPELQLAPQLPVHANDQHHRGKVIHMRALAAASPPSAGGMRSVFYCKRSKKERKARAPAPLAARRADAGQQRGPAAAVRRQLNDRPVQAEDAADGVV